MPTCLQCNAVFPYRVKIDGKYRILHKRKYCLECSPFGTHNTKTLHVKKQREHKWQREKRQERKQRLVKLRGGRCEICSYNRHHGSLDFHHIVPEDKEFELSCTTMTQKSWDAILKEVVKTALLCRNCHGEVHGGLHEDKVQEWVADYNQRKNTEVCDGQGVGKPDHTEDCLRPEGRKH